MMNKDSKVSDFLVFLVAVLFSPICFLMSLTDDASNNQVTLLFGGSTLVEMLLIYSAHCMHLGWLKGFLFLLLCIVVYCGTFVFVMAGDDLFQIPPEM